jgi:hypothetical protein
VGKRGATVVGSGGRTHQTRQEGASRKGWLHTSASTESVHRTATHGSTSSRCTGATSDRFFWAGAAGTARPSRPVNSNTARINTHRAQQQDTGQRGHCTYYCLTAHTHTATSCARNRDIHTDPCLTTLNHVPVPDTHGRVQRPGSPAPSSPAACGQ